MTKKFDKILIANRGEIAMRIIRAAKSLGIKTVALYTLGEEKAAHVKDADEAVFLGNGDLHETYLNINKIVELADRTGAQAIHPGYGFLSENDDFARACQKKGIVFIGPSADVLKKTGNKIVAKTIAQKVGVQVLNTYNIDDIDWQVSQFNFPMIVKASYGGGGKGMRIVRSSDDIKEKVQLAMRAAQNYFGNAEVYLEDYIENARHIEVQILADKHGNIIHLYERDCTVQRNHQKIIEEAPASFLNTELRNKIHDAAISICREVGYENAGTVEFMVDERNEFYFLEINPRIQVEHPVTEQVTGVDIVKEQLIIAAGNPLSFLQNDININGHAIELRIYAENPSLGYEPSGKPINYFSFPDSEGIRIETAIDISSNAVQFDPLLCKLISTGLDREHAMMQLLNALNSTVISGPDTNQLYLKEIIKTPSFQKNTLTTRFCEQNHQSLIEKISEIKENFDYRFLIAASLYSLYNLTPVQSDNVWNSIGYWRVFPNIEISIEGKLYTVSIEKKSNGFLINSGEESFYAEQRRFSKTNYETEIQIDNEKKRFSLVKVNDARINLIYQGIEYKVGAIDNIDYYPENYAVDSDLSQEGFNIIKSHLHGKIVGVNIEKNQAVNKGDVLLVIESMKSENSVISPKKARVKNINVEVGTQVTDQMPLVYLEDL